ncbi:MAG: response regulator [Desulfobacterales bacterium]
MTRLRAASVAIGILLAAMLAPPPAAHSDVSEFIDSALKSARHVLLLHSYHDGMMWTDAIDQGFNEVMAECGVRVDLHVEYMDGKRYSDPDYLEMLHELYDYKYRGVNLSVVAASDDIAFRFALEHRQDLFPGVPIVFCGVNAMDVYRQSPAIEPLMTNLTGVVESYDVARTISLAMEFHPDVETLYIVNDHTVTGRSNRKVLDPVIGGLRDRIEAVYLEDLTMKELLERVGGLPERSVILLMSFNRDRSGRVFSYRESIDLIAAVANRPLYGVWGFYLGRGIVGGMLTSGRFQGETAAELTARILKGESAGELPVVTHSPNVLMFDYRQIQRHKIPEERIPAGSLIVNRPDSFYSRYRKSIWWAATALAVQALVILILAVNIARRKTAEKALKAREVQYRQIFENIQDAYYEVTLEGIVLEMSPSVERVLGYQRSDLIGKSLLDFYIDPSDRSDLLEAILEREWVAEYEIVLASRAGLPVPVAINATLVRDEAGNPVKIVGSMRNIKERKDAEEERQRLEKKLFRIEKMEAIGTLAGGVAHDLNNILSGIVSYPELLLLQLPAGDPLKGPLETIRKAGLRAADVVQDLLVLTRRGMLVKEAVQLNEIVNDCLLSEAFRKLKAAFPNIAFDINLDPGLPPMLGSKSHLGQMLLNLLTNAVEAVERFGVVRVRTEYRTITDPPKGADRMAPGDYVVLSITDNGRGIGAEEMEHIFEPFYTKKKLGRKGTGLGMAVVWGTVLDHDGYIEAQSQEQEGTTFQIYFPVRKEAARHEEGATPQIHRGSGRVLVVDDIEAQREIACAILTRMGYETVSVSSGEDAVSFLDSSSVDFVLLDMIMDPGMDGLETYKRIRERNPGQRVVIASGYSETDRVKEALRLGAAAFVKKPYSISALGKAMQAAAG